MLSLEVATLALTTVVCAVSVTTLVLLKRVIKSIDERRLQDLVNNRMSEGISPIRINLSDLLEELDLDAEEDDEDEW
jgi:hypothetical protein